MRFFRIVTIWILSACVVAGVGSVARAIGGRPAEKSDWWLSREASFLASARGPITAIHAEYLGYRGEANLYVVDDTLRAQPDGRGFGLRVNFAKPGFVLTRVKAKGFSDGTLGGRGVFEMAFVGKEAGDSLDIRVGKMLVSLDMQDAKTGRVMVFDPDRLNDFHGFDVFPDSDRYRVEARLSAADGEVLTMGTSRGLEKRFQRVARLQFRIGGKDYTLSGFRLPGASDDQALFIPFQDRTTGKETYAVGRYLRVEVDGPDRAIVDFNHATNPWCAYSPFYNCVLPPEENDLPLEIRAGEKSPQGH